MTGYKKKLIEVALPLDAINAESAREKSIRHGHPSTLHLWWARRPLAACRAVLFAQLVDDPSSHPEQFPTEEEQDAERARLFRIIEALVKWENSTNEEVLKAARAEIRRSCAGHAPSILDPFAGGGSIPLEAQRLGLEAHASDLNPVAVLINKALIEIPPQWAGHQAVHPDADNRTQWQGAEGLAEDVRRYGEWMRDEAVRRLGHLYPKAALADGTEAGVIAWIWARTVTCPNPACGATMPLVSSLWLSKRKGQEAWLQPIVEDRVVRFDVQTSPGGPPSPPKVGQGAKFRCLVCDEIAPDAVTHDQLDSGRGGAQLLSIVAERNRRRIHLPATDEQIDAATVERGDDVPTAECRGTFASNAQGRRYGFRTFSDYFSNRQLQALMTFASLVDEVRLQVAADADAVGMAGTEAQRYADAVATYLGLAASKMAAFHTTLARWRPDANKTAPAFGRQGIAMVWDYAEVSPFAGAGGDWQGVVNGIGDLLQKLRPAAAGSAVQADARYMGGPGACVIATDPPYYDNIGYADLSDYFYVWLRQSLRSIEPDLFETVLTPKRNELIAAPYRHDSSKDAADSYFEDGFVSVFSRAREVSAADQVLTLFYAFKQAERDDESGIASTGWSTMLEGLASAGWMVTATWPVRTELATKLNMGSNLLASSVVLACRPRPAGAGVADRQGLVRALQQELPGPLHELQKAHVAPVDLRQAAIGPGMAVFSRFDRVIEPSGDTMRVRTALGLINQVLDEVLEEQQQDFDDETRWAINWFSQFYFDQGAYGTAEQLAVSMDVSISGLVSSGILESGGGHVRLLARDELPENWDPRTDLRKPVWEATQHLVRRLESEGEASAARLLRRMPSLGESAQLLAYRLYTLCERSRPSLAGPYNALVASWPEIQRLALVDDAPIVEFEQQRFDT